ncbi:hypothetical protein V493_03428 [Pseudogymnoascus sp. VKM F-4281 (FW-2241)]|nr:hypothetical protein V493_03428 [Pseudogymnoascus sp. VKM F-4281 (FW-2241)]
MTPPPRPSHLPHRRRNQTELDFSDSTLIKKFPLKTLKVYRWRKGTRTLPEEKEETNPVNDLDDLVDGE